MYIVSINGNYLLIVYDNVSYRISSYARGSEAAYYTVYAATVYALITIPVNMP